MPDPDFPETPGDPGDNAETFDDDLTPAEPVSHNSSSHMEWRPEYEVPPPEPGDPVSPRRRVVAKDFQLLMRRKKSDRNA